MISSAGPTTESSERVKILAIVDDLEDVVDKIDEVLASTSTNRRKRDTSQTCSWFDTTLEELIDIASDTSEQSNIATYADTLTEANVDSCSESEETKLKSHKESLEGIIDDYESIIYSAATTMGTSAGQTTLKTSVRPSTGRKLSGITICYHSIRIHTFNLCFKIF